MGRKDKKEKKEKKKRRYSPSVDSYEEEDSYNDSRRSSDSRRKHRKKSKKKDKKKKDRKKKGDRDRSRTRHKKSKKKSSKDKKRRTKSRSLSQLSSYTQSSLDSYTERRRKREKAQNLRKKMYRKSKSPEEDPLARYRRQYASNTNAHGNKVVWDGFQWVEKGLSLNNMDATQVSHTRKMRKVQISNLPVYMGLREEDIMTVVSDFLVTTYLSDQGNNEPIIACELSESTKTAIVECSTVEEATRFAKVNYMDILGVKCKVTRVGESMYGATTNLATLLNNADSEAKAIAVAHKALNMLTKDGLLTTSGNNGLGFDLEAPITTIVKILNLVDPEQAKLFTTREYNKVLDDIVLECAKEVEIIHAFIIRSHHSTIGAETGSVFVQLKDKDEATKLLSKMRNKFYEGKQFQMVCIPEATYTKFFKRLDI